LLGFRKGFVVLAFKGVDFSDHASRGWLDKLAPVIDVSFEAIVMGGIVTGGEADAGSGAKVANREGNLRRGALCLEEVGIATEIGANFGAGFGEVAREMARVVTDHKRRLALTREALTGVGHKTNHGSLQIEKVHRCRADTGMLGTPERTTLTLLGGGHDFANGASTETTGAESHRFEEAVIDFLPRLSLE
jgi:hypothetical protein